MSLSDAPIPRRTAFQLSAAAVMACMAGCAAKSELTVPATEAEQPIAAAEPPFAGWTVRHFPGKRRTSYRPDRLDGRIALRADAQASVSMARRTLALEKGRAHRLQFSWRVPEQIEGADLRQRHAEDAPARLVLAFDGDRSQLPLRDRLMFELAQSVTGEAPPYATLMYVWERRAKLGEVIPSNSTQRIRKIVVDSGDSALDVWRDHERTIPADFLRAFGEPPGPLIGVGLMTDTDNTRSRARVWYGAVRLFDAQGLLLAL